MPIEDFKPTAGYKNPRYYKEFGFNHFGVDAVSTKKNKELYALGTGTVVAAGLDGMDGKTTGKGSGCGYCVVIVYNKCINNNTGKAEDLVVTYMHLAKQPLVKAGQNVTTKTLLGYYGATGQYVTGEHLHIQIDTDTKWPLYCTGLSKEGHNLLKAGSVDSTVNPCEWFWKEAGQTITAPASVWYSNVEFLKIPDMPKTIKKKVLLKDKDNLHTRE